jgi:hypothetical protein
MIIYFEQKFEQGGDSVKLKDNPRMKAFLRLGDEINFALPAKQFSEGDDPGEILHRKTMDILLNPPSANKYGQPILGSINYSMAFEIACEQNPDLAAQYIQQIEETRARNGRPFFKTGGTKP